MFHYVYMRSWPVWLVFFLPQEIELNCVASTWHNNWQLTWWQWSLSRGSVGCKHIKGGLHTCHVISRGTNIMLQLQSTDQRRAIRHRYIKLYRKFTKCYKWWTSHTEKFTEIYLRIYSINLQKLNLVGAAVILDDILDRINWQMPGHAPWGGWTLHVAMTTMTGYPPGGRGGSVRLVLVAAEIGKIKKKLKLTV